VVLDRKRTILRTAAASEVIANFAGRECRVISATDPDSRYSRFSRPVPLLWLSETVTDSALLRKPGSARNRTRDLWTWSQKRRPLYQRGCPCIATHAIRSCERAGEGGLCQSPQVPYPPSVPKRGSDTPVGRLKVPRPVRAISTARDTWTSGINKHTSARRHWKCGARGGEGCG
jgi:hypothetical protein